MKNLTLKRLLKRHKQNPQDHELHEVLEASTSTPIQLDKVIEKIVKHNVVDK